MKINSLICGLLICFSTLTLAQSIDEYFDLARAEFSGEKAFESVAFIEQFWRLPGNSGFDKSIYHLEEKLKAAGFEPENGSTSRFTYRLEKRTLPEPSWEPVSASLTLEGETVPLLEFSSNRNMVAINSHSTSRNGVAAEIIPLEDGRIPPGISAKGKILYGETSPFRVYRLAVESGAAGIITYGNPPYLNPTRNKQSIQFRSIPYNKENKMWAVCLSFDANEKLKSFLLSGKRKATVKIETLFPMADELTLIAEIKGSELPDERFVLSAHVQEPGANDNASGTGALVEMARVSAKLTREHLLDPRRTITFLWGDEISSTQNFVSEDSLRRKNIKWGMSLDMVGENTAITGGSFLIEKMPDPSALWTRGADKHTEWGAGDVKEADFFPHYLNDLVLEIFKRQGSFANWTVNYNPFEGGSDHVPFLRSGIPAVLLWHFTDQFYHTDLDRIDKVSAEELRNVGSAALVTVFSLVDSGPKTAEFIIDNTITAGKERIAAEMALAEKNLQNGGDKAEELKIIEAWSRWYMNAIQSVKDLSAGESEFVRINELANSKAGELKEYVNNLKKSLK